MKFQYWYKTNKNEPQTGFIRAASRDAVYTALKRDGVRPYKVELVPGVLNSLQRFRFHITVYFLLCVIVGIWIWLSLQKNNQRNIALELKGSEQVEEKIASTTRRQIIGDFAIIEKGIRTGWDFVFENDGERFLASFAVPGFKAGVSFVSVDELVASLNRKVLPTKEDVIEARQIKNMVEGMKDELRQFLVDGGSVAQYGKLLVERQDSEIGYYQRAQREIDEMARQGALEEDIEKLWEQRNSELRQMGIRLISMPAD